MIEPPENSYSRMLKSSALLGGASVVSVGLGAVRTKVLAVQLGPQLFGVMGLYVSLTTMIQAIASLGLGQSAVRELAAAAGADNQRRLATVIIAYRRIVMLTGFVGLLMTLAVARFASELTFKNDSHVWAIAILSVTVFFAEIQTGQMALLQGLRRIGFLSAINALGAVCSTALAIPLLLIFKDQGVVPFLIGIGLAQLVVSWLFARRIEVARVKVSWAETWEVAASMLQLGLSFVAIGLATAASTYAIRLVINRLSGESTVGIFQAAYTVSGIYVGFVLTAMAGDFYPRLAGYGDNVEKQNQLVNEQTRLALLLATPALIAALVFSGPLIQIMYSSAFADAAGILRWQVLGLLAKIISWPMGFILLARRDSKTYLASELATNAIHVGLVWLGMSLFGPNGIGIAFTVLYGGYVTAIFILVRARHSYRYQAGTWHLLLASVGALGSAFALSCLPSQVWRTVSGLVLLAAVGTTCLESLSSLIPESRPARLWRAVSGRIAPLRLGLRALTASYKRWADGKEPPTP